MTRNESILRQVNVTYAIFSRAERNDEQKTEYPADRKTGDNKRKSNEGGRQRREATMKGARVKGIEANNFLLTSNVPLDEESNDFFGWHFV